MKYKYYKDDHGGRYLKYDIDNDTTYIWHAWDDKPIWEIEPGCSLNDIEYRKFIWTPCTEKEVFIELL